MSDPSTRAVARSPSSDEVNDALTTPIVQSTTFAADEPGETRLFDYARSGNPTVTALEDRLQRLTGGIGTVAYGSGMAAIDALFRATLEPGDTVLVSEIAYGGTHRLLREAYETYDVNVVPVDTTTPRAVEKNSDEATLVFVETPANPTLALADVEGIAEVADEAGVPLAVDNTFQTPLGQPVLEQGADVAVHSTTKYLEGHGTAVGGALVVKDDVDLLSRLRYLRKTTGTIAKPFEAWLTLRGIETLPARLERISRTAQTVAEHLNEHELVDEVRYPGLPSHAQHELAESQHEVHGGLLAFDVGSRQAVNAFVDALEVATLAEHLGTSRTLVTHPATMTHASISEDLRRKLGITEGLIRVSVGLESPDDLVPDLEQALDRAREVAIDA